jgi:serine protease Do
MEETLYHDDRFPCPRCGEGVLPHARVCPHCRGDVLFDVVVTAPLDGRAAYAAARELSELPSGPPFLAAKRALDAGGRLAGSVTHQLASELMAVLSAHQAAGRLELASPGGPVGRAALASPAWRPLAWAALAASMAIGALWWLGSDREEDSPQVAGEVRLVRNEPSVDAAPLPATEIARLASRSAAALRCGSSAGSGFFVGTERLVTNAHVLCGDDDLRVLLSDGRELVGRPERSDPRLDLALVHVGGASVPPLPLGDASTVSQGDTVYFYGSPRGLDFTLGQALVSHAGRSLRGLSYLQVDGNVNAGNSGGPLLDARGQVVGVVTLRVEDGDGLGLALPVNYLWEGGEPLLAAPRGVTRSAGWESMLRQAADADQRDAAEAREQLSRPGLVGAYLSRGAVVALVVRQSALEPAAVNLDFHLEDGGTAICWPSGSASRWQRMGALGEEVVDAGTRAWLERHGMGVGVWAASVPLAWSGCPPAERTLGQLLVLRDGIAGADRAPVEGYRFGGFPLSR